jgi:hypothetical protein
MDTMNKDQLEESLDDISRDARKGANTRQTVTALLEIALRLQKEGLQE